MQKLSKIVVVMCLLSCYQYIFTAAAAPVLFVPGSSEGQLRLDFATNIEMCGKDALSFHENFNPGKRFDHVKTTAQTLGLSLTDALTNYVAMRKEGSSEKIMWERLISKNKPVKKERRFSLLRLRQLMEDDSWDN